MDLSCWWTLSHETKREHQNKVAYSTAFATRQAFRSAYSCRQAQRDGEPGWSGKEIHSRSLISTQGGYETPCSNLQDTYIEVGRYVCRYVQTHDESSTRSTFHTAGAL